MPLLLLVRIPLAVSMATFFIADVCAGKKNQILYENQERLFPQISHAIFDSEEMTNTTTTGIKDVVGDSFKFGLYTFVVLTLHIILLITLIIFAITGTAAYICSITNCRHFFTSTGGEKPPPKFTRYFNNANDMALKSWDDMKPVAHGLQLNYDRYNDGMVENY